MTVYLFPALCTMLDCVSQRLHFCWCLPIKSTCCATTKGQLSDSLFILSSSQNILTTKNCDCSNNHKLWRWWPNFILVQTKMLWYSKWWMASGCISNTNRSKCLPWWPSPETACQMPMQIGILNCHFFSNKHAIKLHSVSQNLACPLHKSFSNLMWLCTIVGPCTK